MDKAELMEILDSLYGCPDCVLGRREAGDALIVYIDDEEIKAAYRDIGRWGEDD